MNRKPIKDSDGDYAGKRLKIDVINDLITELGRGLDDDDSVRELIEELRRKYSGNESGLQKRDL